jgi:hypothetical protein
LLDFFPTFGRPNWPSKEQTIHQWIFLPWKGKFSPTVIRRLWTR